MTFAELAEARGTSKRAAVVLIRRHGWRRQRDNAGHVRALVPPPWDQPVMRSADAERAGHSAPPTGAYEAPALETLAQALAALQQAQEREREALREAQERERAAHRAEVVGLREALGRAQDEAQEAHQALEQARAEAQKAREAAEALGERERHWWAQGRWVRLKAAWRGE